MYTDIRKRIELGAKNVKLAMLHDLLGLEQLLLVPVQKAFQATADMRLELKAQRQLLPI